MCCEFKTSVLKKTFQTGLNCSTGPMKCPFPSSEWPSITPTSEKRLHPFGLFFRLCILGTEPNPNGIFFPIGTNHHRPITGGDELVMVTVEKSQISGRKVSIKWFTQSGRWTSISSNALDTGHSASLKRGHDTDWGVSTPSCGEAQASRFSGDPRREDHFEPWLQGRQPRADGT